MRCYIILLSACLLFAGTVAFAADLSEQKAYSIFTQANDFFRQANEAGDSAAAEKLYGEAILRYESLVGEGKIANAGLYYNLGNAYLLKSDVGRAILNYRRAERLDDSNPDIKKNLAYARSKRIDKVAVKAEKKVLHTLFFWHYDFSMKIRFVLACVFFGLFFTLLTVRVWFGRRVGIRAGSVLCGFMFVCFAGSVVLETALDSAMAEGVILSQSVIARSGDGYNYQPSFKDPLHAGTEFELIKTQSGWYNIRLSDGSQGWIPTNSADKI